MSPKAKTSLINLTAVIGAIVAVAGLTAPVARAVDQRYVHADTFSGIQQSEAFGDSLRAERHNREIERINEKLADLDTIKTCLRHPQRTMCK